MLSRHSRPRRAFSLVELLVVIAIIVVLISLFLPAVQAAREAARNIECQNHVKQFAIGVANYESAHKCYPPAGLCGDRVKDFYEGPFRPRNGQMLSWMVLILPFIEETQLYRQFDFGQSILTASGDPQAISLAIALCPSDNAHGLFFSDASLTGGKRFAKGNYAAFVSPYHVSYTDLWPGGLSGAHRYSHKDIKDGTSKTLLLSEVRTRDNELDQRGAWALPWTGSTLLAFDTHDATFPFITADLENNYLSSGLSFTPSPLSAGETQRPNNTGPNVDMLYLCPDAAGAQFEGMPCAQFASNRSMAYLSAAPRSRHLGRVNVAFLDGHIGALPDNIDELTMAYLISSNDGQNVDMSQVR
jgi:prepilin-type N-terminal cleavage/methylation domain-containing protein/prepilin-type processing-associated H-X9-DG protein